jgi:PKD repeat protein
VSWLVALVLLFTMTAQGQERQALNGGNSTNSVPEPAGGVPNYGYAIQFNGGGYLSSLTSNTDLNAVAAFTIDFTVATTNANAASGILLSQTSDGTDSGWAFFLIEDYFSFMYHDLSGNPQEMDSDEFPGLTNGLPHYIRIVQNMNNATYTQAIYVDGTRIATATTNAGFRVDSAPFMVGSGIFGGDFYPIFATIDEVRVTTNALIEPDASSYTPDSCPSAVAGTIHLWHFNEGTGTTTTDSVGSATLTMESSPAPTWVTGFCSPSPAQIGVSPTSYAFTAIATGTTEVTTFTVTNSGDIAVTNGSASSTAPFSILSGSPFSVPAHGSTNVVVRFAPTSVGSFTTNVIFTTANGGASTNQVSGTGQTPAQIGVSPPNHDFTAIATGTTEVTTFTVTNYGGIAVSNGTATSTAPFSISSGTPFSVPGHGSTNVTVQFAPTSAGSFATNVIFTTANAGNSTNQVTGTGQTLAQIGVSPPSWAFGSIAMGATATTTFVVANSGDIAVTNGSASSTAPFSISSGTPFSVPGHGSTNVTVQFAPTSAGSFATNVIFTTANAGNSTNQVTGTGIVAIVSMASFTGSPTNGGVPLPVTFTDGSSGTIANWFWNFGDGATTNFAVSTNPVHTYAAGTYTVSLTVSGPLGTSNLTRTNYIVALSPPHLVVNPASRDWHIVTVGQTSNQTFSVMNTGQQTLTGSVLSVTSPFVIVSGSPYNVAAGGTGTVTVSFNSVAGGVFTGTVIFASNGGSSINTVTVLLNAPPVVTAGSSQTVAFPSCASLNGRVTDDGLPYGILTSSWSEVSGPGTVTFGNVNVADTTACFSTNGTYVLCLTASDGAVSRSNTVIVATKVPPQITASPAATNKLAQMDGRTVVAGYGPVCFTVGMYDPNGDPLSCLWDFGDGDTSSDCDPCHVFTNCGPYVVSVTVSDGLASTNATSLVTVTCELTITKMQIKLNFAKTNSDSCSLTAALDLGSDYNLTNKVVTLDIGGTTNTTFTLDAKGKGKGVGHFGSCKLAYNKKMKQWTLRAKLAKGSWQASWATYGLENKNVLKPGIWVKMPVVVLTGDDALADERLVNYTAIKNKSGSAK